MPTARSLTAKAYKEGKQWTVHLPEIAANCHCRTIEQVPDRAAELAANTLGIARSKLRIIVTYQLPAASTAAHDEWHLAQRRLAAAKSNVDTALLELAKSLRRNGYTLKDIGVVTGFSFQRIAQILGAALGPRRPAGTKKVNASGV